MTPQQIEAMKLALEALEKLWSIIDDIDTYSDMAKADDKLYRTLVERRQRMRFKETGITTDGYKLSGGAITALEEALAQPEQDSTYTYASSLATAIWQKHYMKESPKWKPLDTTEGVLTQIDNMTCGLIKEKPAQTEQEPVAWGVDWGKGGDISCVSIIKRLPNGGIEVLAVEYAPYNYTTPPQRKPLTDEEFDKLLGPFPRYAEEWSMTDFIRFARAIEAAHGIKE